MKPDPTNPPHYRFSELEPIHVIEAWRLGFNLGNCIKYIARADHKGSKLLDLQKAAWYLKREIDNLQKEQDKQLVGVSLTAGEEIKPGQAVYLNPRTERIHVSPTTVDPRNTYEMDCPNCHHRCIFRGIAPENIQCWHCGYHPFPKSQPGPEHAEYDLSALFQHDECSPDMFFAWDGQPDRHHQQPKPAKPDPLFFSRSWECTKCHSSCLFTNPDKSTWVCPSCWQPHPDYKKPTIVGTGVQLA